METVTVYSSRKQAIKLFLGSGLFTAMGVFLLMPGSISSGSGNSLIGWLVTLFFGLGTVIFAIQLFGKNEHLFTLNDEGVTNKYGITPWKDIDHFAVTEMNMAGSRSTIIAIKLKESAKPNPGAPPTLLEKAGQAIAAGDINIDYEMSDMPAKRVLALLTTYLEHYTKSPVE